MVRGLCVALSAAIILTLPAAAHAYVDPAAGSMLLQLLLGGVAGLIVIVKLYYRRLLTRLGWRPPEPDSTSPPAEPRP